MPSREVDEERSVRCLKIADFVYWHGSASPAELSAALSGLRTAIDTTRSVVERDLGLLTRHRLPIRVTPDGRYRIQGALPGFSLRLTKREASALWAWCLTHSHVAGEPRLSDTTIADAVIVLQSGLRRFHPGSEVIASTEESGPEFEGMQPAERLEVMPASDFRGEARLVHRRLHLVDLVEKRIARNVGELAAVMDVSQRTIHTDLTVLRGAGPDIRYARDRHEYVAEGLNQYLSDHLTVPMAAALLVFLEPLEDGKTGAGPSLAFRSASRKVAEGIRITFRAEQEALQMLSHR